MNIIGNKIRYLLKLEGLSISDLSKDTNLSRFAIDNVIYGKSKKFDVISKICARLNIEVSTLLDDTAVVPFANSKQASTISNHCFSEGNFSVDIYSQVIAEMSVAILKNKIAISKRKFTELVDKTYLYVVENPENTTKLKVFIEGLITAIR